MELSLLSLFCGAGGLDLGFEEAGFAPQLSFDIRDYSIDTYNYNRPKRKVGHVADVTGLTLEALDNMYGKEFRPKGVIGGPPCQSFSVSNVHKKKDDPRDELPIKYAELLKLLNDRNPIHFFAFENVVGLTNKKFEARYQQIKQQFELAGFNIFPAIMNAADYGVPQIRNRLIIVGLNSSLYPDKVWVPPQATHGDRHVSVEKAIRHLGKATYFSKDADRETFSDHVNHWCMRPKSRKFFEKGALGPEVKGRSFRTLEWGKPSSTIAFGNREVHVHPDMTRRLTVHEAALLQGFPVSYVFNGNMSNQFQQVSEAVPPPLAEQVAGSIRFLLEL